MTSIQQGNNESAPDFGAVYPHRNAEELGEIAQRIRDYVAVAVSIYEYLATDPQAYARFKALTASERRTRIDPERSNPSSP